VHEGRIQGIRIRTVVEKNDNPDNLDKNPQYNVCQYQQRQGGTLSEKPFNLIERILILPVIVVHHKKLLDFFLQ
jgi:hypothetical protein